MYYSPLEQFEPIPYFFPFKLGFFIFLVQMLLIF